MKPLNPELWTYVTLNDFERTRLQNLFNMVFSTLNYQKKIDELSTARSAKYYVIVKKRRHREYYIIINGYQEQENLGMNGLYGPFPTLRHARIACATLNQLSGTTT